MNIFPNAIALSNIATDLGRVLTTGKLTQREFSRRKTNNGNALYYRTVTNNTFSVILWNE